MSDKKKILIIQPIHKAGIDLIKNDPNYYYEIVENIYDKDIKQKILDCDAPVSYTHLTLPTKA